MARAVGVLTGLRSLGTRMHLDDFGSGNSPIGYLQRLPLDGVKIDHTLVNRMDRDEKALRLVRSVVGLAREFGLDVVAEGITSAGHLKVLQEIGCTHGQGQLFSPGGGCGGRDGDASAAAVVIWDSCISLGERQRWRRRALRELSAIIATVSRDSCICHRASRISPRIRHTTDMSRALTCPSCSLILRSTRRASRAVASIIT